MSGTRAVAGRRFILAGNLMVCVWVAAVIIGYCIPALKHTPLVVALTLLPLGFMVRDIGRDGTPRSRPSGFCKRCGYDLRGGHHRCPECGTDVWLG